MRFENLLNYVERRANFIGLLFKFQTESSKGKFRGKFRKPFEVFWLIFVLLNGVFFSAIGLYSAFSDFTVIERVVSQFGQSSNVFTVFIRILIYTKKRREIWELIGTQVLMTKKGNSGRNLCYSNKKN